MAEQSSGGGARLTEMRTMALRKTRLRRLPIALMTDKLSIIQN